MVVTKDKTLQEMRTKFSRNRQILTSNWEQAESEVRRLDEIYHDTVDRVVMSLASVPDLSVQHPGLAQLVTNLQMVRESQQVQENTDNDNKMEVNTNKNTNSMMTRSLVSEVVSNSNSGVTSNLTSHSQILTNSNTRNQEEVVHARKKLTEGKISGMMRASSRGGWNVTGWLKGGSPDPPLKNLAFANLDTTDSEDSDEASCKFAMLDDSSDTGSTESISDEGDSSMLKGNPTQPPDPLPTIYAKKTEEQITKKSLRTCDCDNNCHEFIEEISDDADKDLKSKHDGLSLIDRKNVYLSHLKSQKDILGKDVDGFFYSGHLFCISAFSKLAGLSRHILHKIVEAHRQGLERFVHANSLAPKNSPNKENAICWFRSFCQIYGQRAPDHILVVLPSFLNVTTIFEMYKEENLVARERIKYSTFCMMVKNDFGTKRKDRTLPRVRFSKYSSHSLCSVCSDLDAFQRSCRTQTNIDLCRALKMKHKERFSNQQRCITNLRMLSQSFPDQFFSIFIDGMDNQKSHIPRFQEKTKKLANFYKLPSKITGCIIYSSHYPLNRKIKMFINFDQYEQGN